jgi:site-specific DNA recombinase
MPNTNGHGPKRAILYARVSTDEQARSGYSLAQQLEALRAHCEREGYEVLEEVSDPGQSGASLERPGMDRARDLVAAGGVSVVLAQDRDRFAREPAYHYLLRREFEAHGTKIRALNDRGDESPEGELTDGILDQLAKFERAKMTERTRRGKLKKAREGKVIATNRPHYGFHYNDARDNYVVVEEEMQVVARIFRMVGEEGASLLRVKRTLEREGVPSPNGKRIWGKFFIRECIKDDAYKAHTNKEIETLVEKGQMAPEVAARLDPAKRHGVWWFNRHRTTTTQVAVQDGEGRKRYRRRTSYAPKPESEWIAVPVPDVGIPREWVDCAREAVAKNKSPSRNGGRAWELSGGITRCAECGWTMQTSTVTSGNSPKVNFYYRCSQVHLNPGVCSNRRSHRADRLEPLVWDYISGVMKDPTTLRDDLDRMIELRRRETRGDPHKERKLWAEKLAEVEDKRARYQEMAAENLITFEELRARLAELDETRETAERELAAIRGHEEYILTLERERDALLDSLEADAPEALDSLEPSQRHHWYRLLRLEAVVDEDGNVEVSWAGAPGGESVCQNETLSPSRSSGSSSP